MEYLSPLVLQHLEIVLYTILKNYFEFKIEHKLFTFSQSNIFRENLISKL